MTRDVYLAPSELREAREIAEARRAAHPDACMAFDYELRGVVGEMGAHKYLTRDGRDPLAWLKVADGPVRGLPDIDDFVEVKSVEFDYHNLLVPIGENREPLHDEWAYLMVSVQHVPAVRLVGWAWGLEIYLHNTKVGREGEPAWQAKKPLRDPADLFDFLSTTLARARAKNRSTTKPAPSTRPPLSKFSTAPR